ncbi:MAG: 4a-hydroxytetrahydrobiopterin dehydratase [Ignavibacteria bacterium]|nr:4a-hydroxytetrahydrobiopterin dehydratase [Ignavibacteria bacterium]
MSNLVTATETEIRDFLEENPLWTIENNSLVREIVASNFVSAVGLINSIAILAEKHDHHPDILLYGWNKLRVVLSTHSANGITSRDFSLAKDIDFLIN